VRDARNTAALFKAEFQECPTCRAKAGTPTLCDSCVHNRRLIGALQNALAEAISGEMSAISQRALSHIQQAPSVRTCGELRKELKDEVGADQMETWLAWMRRAP